jgi:hypothetical protein
LGGSFKGFECDIFKGVIEAALGVERVLVVATNLDSPVSFDLA